MKLGIILTMAIEHMKQYQFKPGENGNGNSGRKKGGFNKPNMPALPPIHVDDMPYALPKLKRADDCAKYYTRIAPKVLTYMFKRMNMFFVYAEKGYPDPLGKAIFDILGKEIVKDVRLLAGEQKKAGDKEMSKTDTKQVKKFRKSLVNMQKTLVEDVEPLEDEEPKGEYSADVDVFNNLESLDSDF